MKLSPVKTHFLSFELHLAYLLYCLGILSIRNLEIVRKQRKDHFRLNNMTPMFEIFGPLALFWKGYEEYAKKENFPSFEENGFFI